MHCGSFCPIFNNEKKARFIYFINYQLKILTMKTLIYFFGFAMLLFAGCAKDEMFTDDSASNLKSAPMKMVPIKADFYSVTNNLGDDGLPIDGYLVGNFSHLGKIIPEKSTWTAETLNLTQEVYVTYVEGQLAAANSDLLFYSFTGTLDFAKNELTALVEYNGGTGRFENCTGEAVLTGYLNWDTGSFIMKVDGMITNVGSSK